MKADDISMCFLVLAGVLDSLAYDLKRH